MNKNIYEMLNDSDINLDEYEKEEFNDIEKKKIKKSFRNLIKKKKNYKKGIVAAVLSIGITFGLFGTNIGLEVVAAINIIGSDIASRLGIESNLDDYKTVINKEITEDGITIQLNEVILDGDELIVSSTLKSSEDKIEELHINTLFEVYINGKGISSAGGVASKKIDEYTMEETIKYAFNDSDLTGDLDVKIVYRERVPDVAPTSRGPWIFEFKTNGDELAIDTEIIELDHKFILDNGQEITIEKFTKNSVGQKIYYTKSYIGDEYPWDDRYHIELVGEDNLGNKVEFGTGRSSQGKGMFGRNGLDGYLSSEAKSITLTLYAAKIPEISGMTIIGYKKVGEEFTIDLNK